MDATKASDMRTLQLHRLHQATAEGNVPEANITHATRCPHTHVFRAQACSQQAGRGGSNSLPGSALTETSRPQWSRATKPKLRGGDKEANGVAVKRGSPQARALGGVQRGHPRAWRALLRISLPQSCASTCSVNSSVKSLPFSTLDLCFFRISHRELKKLPTGFTKSHRITHCPR